MLASVSSIRASVDEVGVVSKGFSQNIRWPWAILKRATRPFPLFGTDSMAKSCPLNSPGGSVPDTD